MAELSGQCLCGACQFVATPKSLEAGVCHCRMCRQWTGGIFLSTDCGSSVRFADDAPIASYKGSNWGERVFCAECGSSMVWQTQDGDNQNVSIQCFDDPEQFTIDHEIFIDRKPANYALAGTHKTMTEAEVFAMFAPDAGGQS